MKGRGILATTLVAAMFCSGAAITPSAKANETVLVCDVYGDQVAPNPGGLYGIGASTSCPGNDDPQSYTLSDPPGGMAIWTGGDNTIPQGTAVHWTVTAPTGMMIHSVYVPHMYSYGIDDGTGWGGGFFWSGGSNNVSTFDGETGWSSGTTSGPGFTWPPGGTPYFGWQVVCGVSSCSNGGDQWLSVELLELNMQETSGPWLFAPDGLWQASGWIRGSWQLHFFGDSPSGLCSMSAALNGQTVASSSSGVDPAVWHQCAAPAVDQAVNTAQYGQGAVPLTLSGTDAATEPVSDTKTLDIDNQTPTVSLSGPTDAPSTAGTQYVTAEAGAGPSGVAGISCSVDNAPSQWYAATSVRIPIQGIGVHEVSCLSEGNARDASGNLASSTPATWTLSIRSPSVSTVSFERVVDALRCKATRERVRIPAHWVTASYHGHPVRTKLPAQIRTIRVVHCHPRVIRRRVRVHGRWRTVRVVVLPHDVLRSTRRVRAGAGAAVSGWLGTAAGDALGGQVVRVLTAPDNGSDQFAQAAVVTTAANGGWSAILPPGPSRLVVASYAGSATIEPALSPTARLVVPASVSLNVRPDVTHWGGHITISGRLRGGFVPPAGEIVVLWIGWPGGSTEIGHLYARRDGRFSSRYTFLRGNGTETYRLWADTARESDYPYAPASSRHVSVTVGQ
jgi:hypothetical protein